MCYNIASRPISDRLTIATLFWIQKRILILLTSLPGHNKEIPLKQHIITEQWLTNQTDVLHL